MITIKEIAQMANVSRGTVDRVLNGRGSVNPETEQRVLAIASAMGYTPNLAGKTLAIKKKKLKFGFILINSTNNPFFADVESGIHSMIKPFTEYGVEILLRYTPLDDTDAQLSAIDQLVSEGIQGLAITPINTPSVCRRLRQLTEAGIAVISVNTDVPNCGRLAYVGSDYHQSGQTAAGLMNIVTAGAAQVGIVAGSMSILCHSERIRGFQTCCTANYPTITTVETVLNGDDDILSYQVTRDLLERHPEISALYLVSAGVVGACRAVTELGLGRQVKVISHDLSDTTRRLLKSGVIYATICQEPYYQGKKPLDILLDYLGIGKPPKQEYYYTRSDIIIRENCDTYPFPSADRNEDNLLLSKSSTA